MLQHAKHMFLCCLFLFCIGTKAHSQTGLTAGTGASDIIFPIAGQSPYLGYEVNILTHNYPAPCYQAGVSQHLALSEHFIGTAGLQFCRRGLNYTTSFLYDDLEYRLHIYYLRLPLLVKIRTRPGSGKLSGPVAGGYASATLGSRLVMKSGDSHTRTPKENLRNMDAGILLGYCWDIGKSPGKLLLNLRMAYGLMDVMDVLEGTVAYDGPENFYARNASLELGLEFLL